jgi:putative PEP-CTERM system response regulator
LPPDAEGVSEGMATLKEMLRIAPLTKVIVVTGNHDRDNAIKAVALGAYDFYQKPVDTDVLRLIVSRAFHIHSLEEQIRALRDSQVQLPFEGLIATDEAMRKVCRMVEKVAPTDVSVLILGESGTGKELVARAVHTKSERAKGPFMAINCAALPKDILENELFGHEKGAFTGSTNEKPGHFEMADGGTLFLDEVAEMPPDIQVKLLRAIETRTVRRLGGKKEIAVDIRIVAATNKDLQKALADNELREDLYYRLAVVELPLPPLRERSGDLRLLAEEFLARFARSNNKRITGFDDAAWDWILSYHWPGNVRELKNAVERAVIMARGDRIMVGDIMPRHLQLGGEVAGAVTIPVGATLADARRQLVLRTFASTGGDHARSARILGVSPEELSRELEQFLRSGDVAGNGSGAVTAAADEEPEEGTASSAAGSKARRSAPAGAAARGAAKSTKGKGR